MRDFLLLAGMLAGFGYGWFLMGKLNIFLKKNQKALAEQRSVL